MKLLHDKNLYIPAATKLIDEVLIFGVREEPKAVLNKFAMRANNQGKVHAEFYYIESTHEVHVMNLRIPVDEDLFYGQEQDLLKVIF
jgi:hypothetical protein